MSPGSSGDPGSRPAGDRAEELVDRVSRDVGRSVARLFARAREEAADVWADAQEVRRGERPTGDDRAR